MGSMKKPTKVDLTFIKAPDYMMDDSDNKFIFDRLKIPDPWVKDLNKWIQYIKSDSKMMLKNISKFTLSQNTDSFHIDAHSKKIIEIKTIVKLKEMNLTFEIQNAYIEPSKNPKVSFFVKI